MKKQKDISLISVNEELLKKLAESSATIEQLNRELEIEAALEKVRSRTMAMQKSDELTDVASLLFAQVNALGIKTWTAGFNVWSDDNNSYVDYITSPSGGFIEPYTVHTERAEALRDISDARKSGVEFDVMYVEGEKIRQLYLALTGLGEKQFEKMLQDGVQFPSHQYEHFVFGSKVSLMFITYEPVPEAHDIFKRLGKVFEQTYTRFLDLQKAEAQAEQARKDLILIQTEKKRAEDALSELKQTQNQLIQKEKLASLGELTAGIAHEIQNPLNFVNNFSELSVDLIKEIQDERQKRYAAAGREARDEALENELLADLSSNQEKINHHGKRASSIVKGMLEHSRTSTGEKVLTDINQLADEYLRLSYHGMRAKNSKFNSDFTTEFDENLLKIKIIPQEIGRVLLNLLNNAFYAVSQKPDSTTFKKLSNLGVPTVIVSTKKSENTIEISVKDNGRGIPNSIKEKIFQPFFTTKPTGEGSTGLGLSLAYDIVAKGNGGTLEVVSVEGEGAEFIVRLPIKTN